MTGGLTRRRFAAIAITTPIWITPVVTTVSVAGASQAAHMGSRPRPTAPPRQESPPAPHEPDSALPYTGNNETVVAIAGTAAVVAGASLIATNRLERELDG